MKPEEAQQLGQLLKARREERGLSMRGLARATAIHQTTIVRLEAGSIVAPKADKLSRIAEALGIGGADYFALAGYAVPADLPSLRPYLRAKYQGLLSEDLDPTTGELWGNFPQTYSMVGLINSAMHLSKRWEDAF